MKPVRRTNLPRLVAIQPAQALDAIGDPFKQDGARAACAPKLAKAGKVAEAVVIAKKIKDQFKRDAVLKDLAKGP